MSTLTSGMEASRIRLGLVVAITTMVFDLDGTLVKTEKLKADSYARAAIDLCPHTLDAAAVTAAFVEVVGLSRREVATHLIEHFDLHDRAMQLAPSLGASTAWQAFVEVRLRHYEKLISDPDVLRANRWLHNVELLRIARETRCRTALATMSHRKQALHVLRVLELEFEFDFVATRDDVVAGKPDPEIYSLVSAELAVAPAACLVIEDSPAGVAAALAAGMHCVAVATPFTQHALHDGRLLDQGWIVDDPRQLLDVVRAAHAEAAHSTDHI